MGGVLSPGQKVGIVASIPKEEQDFTGTFSKATIENLRVLYIDPRFAASGEANVVPAASTPQGGDNLLTGVNTEDRTREGAVVLAVDTNLQTIFYDFSANGAISENKQINALELLSAITNMPGATVTLYPNAWGRSGAIYQPRSLASRSDHDRSTYIHSISDPSRWCARRDLSSS